MAVALRFDRRRIAFDRRHPSGNAEAARELRDRWLEQVNRDPAALASNGKYDVIKSLAGPSVGVVGTIPALPSPIAA